MPAAALQFVFRPNPGADLGALLPLVKEVAGLWKEHGAQDVSLWGVQVGEAGNMALTLRFDSAARLGEVLEGMNSDQKFAAWRARTLKAGLHTWVRSNQLYEIPL